MQRRKVSYKTNREKKLKKGSRLEYTRLSRCFEGTLLMANRKCFLVLLLLKVLIIWYTSYIKKHWEGTQIAPKGCRHWDNLNRVAYQAIFDLRGRGTWPVFQTGLWCLFSLSSLMLANKSITSEQYWLFSMQISDTVSFLV